MFHSHVLRQDKAPLDRSALPADEREHLNEFLQQMKTTSDMSSSMSKEFHKNGADAVPIRTRTALVKCFNWLRCHAIYLISNASFSILDYW
jgi:hypothetical protein